MDDDAFFFGFGELFFGRRHLLAGLQAIKVDFLGALAEGGARHVRADVAAADDDDLAGELLALAEVDVAEEVDAAEDLGVVFAF